MVKLLKLTYFQYYSDLHFYDKVEESSVEFVWIANNDFVSLEEEPVARCF